MSWTIDFVKQSDAKEILDIYAPYVRETTFSFEYEAPSLEAFAERIQGIAAVYPYLICRQAGRIVGYAYASRPMPRAAYQWNAELSVYVHPDFHKQGIGRALYSALIRLLRAQNVHTLYAIITVPNERSVAFHRSMGFRQAAVFPNAGYKHGSWRDILWMEQKIVAFDQAPEPLKACADLDSGFISQVLADAVDMLS